MSNRAERRRQAKEDIKLLARGIDPDQAHRDPEPIAAMARQISALLEQAKSDGDVDGPIEFLYSKIGATLVGLRDVTIACRRGCSHCCYIWVSASAPEVLFIAKQLRRRPDLAAVKDRVKAAHLQTKEFSFDVRDQHPHPCPLLVNDMCSIYAIRPQACRLAASGDAEICARSYHNVTNEDIPTPVPYFIANGSYAIALALALRHCGFPHCAYEFNGALNRALERDDAEQAWLAGEDIFSDLLRDPNDPFADGSADVMLRRVFAQ